MKPLSYRLASNGLHYRIWVVEQSESGQTGSQRFLTNQEIGVSFPGVVSTQSYTTILDILDRIRRTQENVNGAWSLVDEPELRKRLDGSLYELKPYKP